MYRSSMIRLGWNRKSWWNLSAKEAYRNLMDAVRDSTDGKTGSDPLPDFCSAYADAAYDLWKKDKISDFRPYLTDEE